jgi:hypothetical protein
MRDEEAEEMLTFLSIEMEITQKKLLLNIT